MGEKIINEMKYIKLFEQYISEAKKFKIGDMWSKDFDYGGMLAAGLKVNVNTPVKQLNKLFDSFTDVNYHTEAQSLGIAIDWIDDGDKKGAKEYMDTFHKVCKEALKTNEAKEHSFIFNYNTDKDDIEYIQKVLDRAGADAVAKAGIDSEEMVIRAFNAKGLRNARKAIEADGFQIQESKDYGDKIDLKDFKKIKKGSKIQYMGGPVAVVDNNGFVLKLKDEYGKVFTVNKSQFDHGGRLAEGKFNKMKLMKAMKKDDGIITLNRGQEYVIYNPNNGNDDNTDMWGDNTIFALDSDGEEHEIKYSDIVSFNESSSTDGGDKSNGNSHHEDHKGKSIAQHWKDTYGEEFHAKYPAIAKIVKSRPGMDRRELKRIWDETYGENFEEQYPALWQKID